MKSEIIKTKLELHWHFVNEYLDLLSKIYILREDKVFCEKLDDLKKYLDTKLQLASDGEIIETYVTVLQQSNE